MPTLLNLGSALYEARVTLIPPMTARPGEAIKVASRRRRGGILAPSPHLTCVSFPRRKEEYTELESNLRARHDLIPLELLEVSSRVAGASSELQNQVNDAMDLSL